MPYIISTPEDWFRSQQRDLNIIKYKSPAKTIEDISEEDNQLESDYKKAQLELNAWFEDKLPHTPLKVIAASEYSGWLTGGPCYFTADFDSFGLALFNSEWDEHSNWSIEVWLFSDWLKRIDAAKILTSPVDNLKKMRWWDTPQGILLVSAYTENGAYNKDRLLSLEDGWWKLQQAFPELAGHHANTFPCGQFCTFRIKELQVDIYVEFVWDEAWESRAYVKNTINLKRLVDVIGIPNNLTVTIQVYEY